jgi:UMF1 family MFS transporter
LSWLERLQLHRPDLRAWALYDWANSVYYTTVLQIFPIYFVRVAAADKPAAEATSLYAWITAAAALVVAILAPVLGAVADHSGWKKRFFTAFLVAGVVPTALLVSVGRGDWLWGGALLLVANAGVTGTLVFYESFLPHLAQGEKADQLATTGFAFGYFSGGLLLAINLAWISNPQRFGMADAGAATRLSFLSAAIWWALFAIPFLRRIAEPPRCLIPGETASEAPMHAAFRRLRTTFHEIRRYRQALLVLLAVIAYNDGISTIIRLGTTYGTEIGIPASALIGAVLLVQAIGIPCSILFGVLARRIGAKRAIYVGLAGYTLIAFVGYGMRTGADFYVLAILLGMVQGGTQALSRSLFASMTPPHRSSEFFGFYGVFDRVSGILGPALFAVATTLTGSGRLAILALTGFFVLGAALLAQVDVEAGRRAAREAVV